MDIEKGDKIKHKDKIYTILEERDYDDFRIGHNFKRLVKKYSNSPVYLLEGKNGFHDPDNGGVWVPETVEEVLLEIAAIVPLSNDDLKFDEGGTFNQDTRKLYCYKDKESGLSIYFVERGEVDQSKGDKESDSI